VLCTLSYDAALRAGADAAAGQPHPKSAQRGVSCGSRIMACTIPTTLATPNSQRLCPHAFHLRAYGNWLGAGEGCSPCLQTFRYSLSFIAFVCPDVAAAVICDATPLLSALKTRTRPANHERSCTTPFSASLSSPQSFTPCHPLFAPLPAEVMRSATVRPLGSKPG